MSLTASQRILVIKQASARLAVDGWSLIDLTLKQFSLPWSAQWEGSKEDYVIHMVQDATDQQLIELAAHLGFDLYKANIPSLDPPFWRSHMLKVFVSHISLHRRFAAQLQQELYRYGISCFVAHNDIESTQEWQREIQTALATCDALVALLHPNFHASNWTDQEIGFAMGHGVPVFAIHAGQDPYGFIGRFQAFQGAGKTASEIALELFDAYRSHKQTAGRMADVLVTLFAESDTYAEAKTRIGYLEELKCWDPHLTQRVKDAAEQNSQI